MENSVKSYYSFGAWTIKPGREEEFRSAWKDFAQWTSESRSGAAEGILVQDADEPKLFYCFWPFDSKESIERWRADMMFRQHMMRMRAYCESCRPSVATVVEKI